MVHAIWLSDPSNWLPDTTLEHRAEIKAEGQVKREIFYRNQVETQRRVQSALKKYSTKSYGGAKKLKNQLTSSPNSQQTNFS